MPYVRGNTNIFHINRGKIPFIINILKKKILYAIDLTSLVIFQIELVLLSFKRFNQKIQLSGGLHDYEGRCDR